MTASLTFFPELILRERCDRCVAAAKVRVLFAFGSELLFCGHHALKYRARLLEVATDLQWGR